jgi:hypothetical protein
LFNWQLNALRVKKKELKKLLRKLQKKQQKQLLY